MDQEQREALSEREMEILRLVVTGVTNREIARRLVISPNTVKVHLRNIFAKLRVESRTEAALVAMQNGWFALPATARFEPVPAVKPLSWGRRGLLLGIVATALAMALWPWRGQSASRQADAMSDPVTGRTEGTQPDMVRRWSGRAPLAVARQRFACVAWQGEVLVIGGDTMEGVTAQVERYDAAADQWRGGAAKPTPASNIAAVAIGDEVYVPGGFGGDGQVLDVLEVYDAGADQWRTGVPLPSPRCAYALAAVGDELFLFGGWDGTQYVADVLIYNREQDTWRQGTPLPASRGFAAAGVVDGYVYVVGGYDGRRELADCLRYAPTQEGSGKSPWETLSALAAPRAGLALVVTRGRLYAIGGGWNGGLTFNEVYDVRTGHWAPFPTPILNQWRTLGAAVVDSALGSTIYAVGGWSGERLAVNQAYRAILNVYLPGLQ